MAMIYRSIKLENKGNNCLWKAINGLLYTNTHKVRIHFLNLFSWNYCDNCFILDKLNVYLIYLSISFKHISVLSVLN